MRVSLRKEEENMVPLARRSVRVPMEGRTPAGAHESTENPLQASRVEMIRHGHDAPFD